MKWRYLYRKFHFWRFFIIYLLFCVAEAHLVETRWALLNTPAPCYWQLPGEVIIVTLYQMHGNAQPDSHPLVERAAT